MKSPAVLSGPAVLAVLAALALLAGAAGPVIGACGPFTDVSDAAFCPFVLEVFTMAITTGTTPTTYDPASNVTRLQMAAFLSRTVDRTRAAASSSRRGPERRTRPRSWPSWAASS